MTVFQYEIVKREKKLAGKQEEETVFLMRHSLSLFGFDFFFFRNVKK